MGIKVQDGELRQNQLNDLLAKTPKANGFKSDPQASETFLREIDAFRRRRRFGTFIKVRPFITYLISKGKKDDFYDFVSNLEKLRCSLGMNVPIFYKMTAEFVLAPGGRHYYIPQHLFDSISWEAEEFRDRIFNTLANLPHVVEERNNEEEIMKFISKVEEVNRHILDMKCGRVTKDWFCLAAVMKYVKEKGWTKIQLQEKLKIYYRRRMRKVYPETLLMDVVARRGLDEAIKPQLKKKKDVIDSIHREDWFSDWEQQLQERHEKDESGEDIE